MKIIELCKTESSESNYGYSLLYYIVNTPTKYYLYISISLQIIRKEEVWLLIQQGLNHKDEEVKKHSLTILKLLIKV